MTTGDKSEIRILSVFLLLYITILGLICYLKLDSFQYTDFDLAVHTQSLHNMLNGSLECSILGIPYPGNHMALSLLLIAPLYFLMPSPLTILLFQTVALAVGSVAVLLYARKYLPRPYPAIAASLYLLYPPLIYMNLYEFHPVALATTFLLFALLSYDRSKPRSYALFLVLAMACQENISLIVIMLGIKALFERRKLAWVIPPIAAGAVWFGVCVFWIMPQFNPGIMRFDAIYGHLGNSLPSIVVGMLSHPVTTLKYMLTLPKMLYLASMLLPLALTTLLAPLQLLPALPVIAQRLLSERGSESTMLFHYQAELIPFIFVSAIHGLHRLGKLRNQRWQHAAVVCMVALTLLSVDMSQVDDALRSTIRQARSTRQLNMIRRGILKHIPDDANITSTFRYLPKLAARNNLHSLHHIYTGFYTLSNTPYPLPMDQDFLLLDTDDPLTFGTGGFYSPEGFTHLQMLASTNDLRLIAQVTPMLLLGHPPGNGATEHHTQQAAVTTASSDGPLPIITDVKLTNDSKDYMRLSIDWQTTPHTPPDFDCIITITSDSQPIKRLRVAPGNRIHPPNSWQPNSKVGTSHRIFIPDTLPTNNIHVTVSILPL